MRRFFGSQAIQLSSDDEDELGNSGIPSGFGGCVPCLSCLTPLTGGTIQLTAEDATLNDYLDPTTTTTIAPLLEEYSHQERDSAFNRATLSNSHQILSRNPFASSSSPITKATISSGTSKNDSYQEQHDSFAGALPRVDFFMENDDDGDAEFLSDHRISAVIGDTSKLAAQLELFDSQVGNAEEDGDASSLDADNDNEEDEATLTRPFEIQSDWTQDMDSIDDEDSHHPDPDTTELLPVDNVSLDANDIDDSNDGEVISERQLVENVNDNGESINAQNAPFDNKVESPCGSNSSDTVLMEKPLFNNDGVDDLLDVEANTIKEDVFKAPAPLLASSPPSPLPSISTDYTENINISFPATSLPRTVTPTQVSSLSSQLPEKATYHQEPLENDEPLFSNILHGTELENSPSPDNDINTAHSSTTDAPAVPDNSVIGRRRSSVAAVAHSLLGDKLDDFTEKLAYIRKNIIMSLDDDDDDDEDEDSYNEDNINFTPQHQQQLRRSRSGSMQPDARRQSYQHVSSNQHSGDPRTSHRRSNSMMDLAPSFAKIVQQIGGTEGKPDYRHFSPSSFFASLAGPDLPSSSSEPQTSNTSSHRESSISSLPSQYPSTSDAARHDKTHDTDPLSDVDEDEEDLFDFTKVIEMGKNVRHYSEDLMGNGMRLFNDFSTRMKNSNTAARMSPDQLLSTSQHQPQLADEQHTYQKQPPPQQENSSMDQEFLLGDTFF